MIRRCGPGVCAVESRGPVPDFDQKARLRAKKGIGSREMGHFTTSPFHAVSKHSIGLPLPKKREKSTGAGRFIPPSYPYSISRLSTFDE